MTIRQSFLYNHLHTKSITFLDVLMGKCCGCKPNRHTEKGRHRVTHTYDNKMIIEFWKYWFSHHIMMFKPYNHKILLIQKIIYQYCKMHLTTQKEFTYMPIRANHWFEVTQMRQWRTQAGTNYFNKCVNLLRSEKKFLYDFVRSPGVKSLEQTNPLIKIRINPMNTKF